MLGGGADGSRGLWVSSAACFTCEARVVSLRLAARRSAPCLPSCHPIGRLPGGPQQSDQRGAEGEHKADDLDFSEADRCGHIGTERDIASRRQAHRRATRCWRSLRSRLLPDWNGGQSGGDVRPRGSCHLSWCIARWQLAQIRPAACCAGICGGTPQWHVRCAAVRRACSGDGSSPALSRQRCPATRRTMLSRLMRSG